MGGIDTAHKILSDIASEIRRAEKDRGNSYVIPLLRKIVRDAGKVLVEDVLDYKVLVTSRGNIEEVRLLLGYGGPTTELVVSEDYIYERVCQASGCYDLDYTEVVDARLLREAFDALVDAIDVCRR